VTPTDFDPEKETLLAVKALLEKAKDGNGSEFLGAVWEKCNTDADFEEIKETLDYLCLVIKFGLHHGLL
jgi:hypothetical protein